MCCTSFVLALNRLLFLWAAMTQEWTCDNCVTRMIATWISSSFSSCMSHITCIKVVSCCHLLNLHDLFLFSSVIVITSFFSLSQCRILSYPASRSIIDFSPSSEIRTLSFHLCIIIENISMYFRALLIGPFAHAVQMVQLGTTIRGTVWLLQHNYKWFYPGKNRA